MKRRAANVFSVVKKIPQIGRKSAALRFPMQIRVDEIEPYFKKTVRADPQQAADHGFTTGKQNCGLKKIEQILDPRRIHTFENSVGQDGRRDPVALEIVSEVMTFLRYFRQPG